MSVTLDTSHLEMSPANAYLYPPGEYFTNNRLISVTADTSQDPTGPCGLSEQSADSCRHSTTAAWSCALDCGAHPVARHYYGLELRRGVTLAVRVIVVVDVIVVVCVPVAVGAFVVIGIIVTVGVLLLLSMG